jgi:hypothetical protein
MEGSGKRPAQALAVLPSMSKSSVHTFPQDLTFEGR